VYEEFPVYGTRLSLDFFCANKNIAIEVQGAAHTRFVPFFHTNQDSYLHQIKKDDKKRKFCNMNRIRLIEVFEGERDQIDHNFIKKILNEQ
jgi:hypothetical protein